MPICFGVSHSLRRHRLSSQTADYREGESGLAETSLVHEPVTHEFGSFDNRVGADYFPVSDNRCVGAGRRGLTIDFHLRGRETTGTRQGNRRYVMTLYQTMIVTWSILFLAPSSSWAQSIVAAVLPSSRSVQVGTFATAFATIINTGSVTATNCGISLVTAIPATFSFQTTNPLTNQAIGFQISLWTSLRGWPRALFYP